jgi:beta-lactamase class A
MKKPVLVATGLLALAGAFGAGYGLTSSGTVDSLQTQTTYAIGTETGQSDYPLLAKRIFVDNPNDTIMDLAKMRGQVNRYIDTNIGKDNVSLYFEYLPTGVSFDPGYDHSFVAASLLKVPQVMNLYKAAELGTVDLDKELPLQKSWLDGDYGTLHKKGAGYKLSLREAARLALTESDNTAIAMISAVLIKDGGLRPDQEAMNFIDSNYQVNADNKVLIGSTTYSSILKCLYFSCYLSPGSSQQILGQLTQSTANNRLRAGVPTDVAVAHKIGTFSQEVQSDCGIVYVPNRNYVLCIMLKQPDVEGSQHIATISRLIYSYVESIGR